MKRNIILTAVLLLVAVSAWAQMGEKPGAEIKKLDYFAGTWTTEGTISPGPWGAGGKFSGTDTSEWMNGNFFLVAHGDFKLPPELGGDGMETSILGYDTDKNVFTRDRFNSAGRHDVSKGTVNGDTWTWTSTAVYGGQEINQKMTIKTLTPTSYSMKFEISMDGTNWTTFMDGKATKK